MWENLERVLLAAAELARALGTGGVAVVALSALLLLRIRMKSEAREREALERQSAAFEGLSDDLRELSGFVRAATVVLVEVRAVLRERKGRGG